MIMRRIRPNTIEAMEWIHNNAKEAEQLDITGDCLSSIHMISYNTETRVLELVYEEVK